MVEQLIAAERRSRRVCWRCGRPLTDPASINAGIGPICRRLDNRLLARLLPVDLEAATRAYHSIDPLTLDAVVVGAFETVGEALKSGQDKKDWRIEVRQVEWILSFGQTEENALALMNVVRALGYIGIVNVWLHEATTAVVRVFFKDGHLYFDAQSYWTGQKAIREISGWVWSPEEKLWSVPADQADKFFLAIASYYPNNEGLEAAVEQARAYNQNQENVAEATSAVAIGKIPLSIGSILEDFGSFLVVHAPYNSSFIEKIKALPSTDRRWNADRKEWEIMGRHRDEIMALIGTYFPEVF